jgi:DNA polymerase III epsilon subunit-like protein
MNDVTYHIGGVPVSRLIDAPALSQVVKLVYPLLQDCLLVGHCIGSDVRSLGIDPKVLLHKRDPVAIYDTASFKWFQECDGGGSLKNLSRKLLGRSIQSGSSHDAVQDAQAAMDLYMRCVQG